nr:hypothetical protein [Kibdelosporangium sp. MJ126-NF4]
MVAVPYAVAAAGVRCEDVAFDDGDVVEIGGDRLRRGESTDARSHDDSVTFGHVLAPLWLDVDRECCVMEVSCVGELAGIPG